MQREPNKDEWDEPSDKAMWFFFLFFGVPWVLGMGVVGMFLLDLMDIRLW